MTSHYSRRRVDEGTKWRPPSATEQLGQRGDGDGIGRDLARVVAAAGEGEGDEAAVAIAEAGGDGGVARRTVGGVEDRLELDPDGAPRRRSGEPPIHALGVG